MPNKTILNIKIESDLKKQAKEVADEMGLPLSVIVNNYLRQFVKDRRVIFDTTLTPNAATAARLDDVLRDLKADQNMAGPFATTDEFFASLES